VYVEVGVWLQAFLTSALEASSQLELQKNNTVNNWIRCWYDPRVSPVPS